MVNENSTHDRKIVGSNLVSSNILDGDGVEAMPGSIPAPNSESLWKNKKNTASQMGHSKKMSLIIVRTSVFQETRVEKHWSRE